MGMGLVRSIHITYMDCGVVASPDNPSYIEGVSLRDVELVHLLHISYKLYAKTTDVPYLVY